MTCLLSTATATLHQKDIQKFEVNIAVGHFPRNSIACFLFQHCSGMIVYEVIGCRQAS